MIAYLCQKIYAMHQRYYIGGVSYLSSSKAMVCLSKLQEVQPENEKKYGMSLLQLKYKMILDHVMVNEKVYYDDWRFSQMSEHGEEQNEAFLSASQGETM